jgi:hypothetical protein
LRFSSPEIEIWERDQAPSGAEKGKRYGAAPYGAETGIRFSLEQRERENA